MTHVTTFAEALRHAKSDEFDVCILDLKLPDGAGPGLVAQLSQVAPDLPIIVLTGTQPVTRAGETLVRGAQDWFSKEEVSRHDLRRSIEYAIDRKSFERKFAEGEERFRQLADNTQSIFWIFNADLSKVIYVNSAYDRITGANRERLYDDPMAWMHVVHPGDRAAVMDALEKLGRGEAALDMRVRIRRPDTSIRWLHMRGFTIRNAEGEIYRIAGTIDDITDLHESEARAREASARLTEILSAAGEGVVGLDPEARVAFINPAASAMLGRESEPLVGKPIHDVLHGGSGEHAASECPIIEAVQGRKRLRVEADRFARTGGDPFLARYVVTPMGRSDPGGGAVIVFSDTTQQRAAQEAVERAEARLRGIFESSSNRIILTDAEGTILAVNRPTDKGGPAVAPGGRVWETLPEGSPAREEVVARFNEARSGRASRFILKLPEHGSVRDVNVTPLGPPGAVTEILWETRDVSDLYTARREAEQAKARLEDLQRLREQLLNNVAHDMSTPLMVLQLKLDRIEAMPAGSDGARVLDARSLESFQAATRQLTALTQDLRDVALLEAGSFRLHLHDTDLRRVAEAKVRELSEVAARAGVTLHVDVPQEPHIVRADEGRMGQALTNLLTNAIKFTPPQGKVMVRLGRDAGRVFVDVADTGPGIPKEARPELFRPFTQVHPDKEARKGTGLGLYIVRGILRAHGGDASIVDTPAGQGATFRLEVPEPKAT